MTETAIRVEGLSKQYRIGELQGQHRTLRDTVIDAVASPIRRLKSFGQASHRSEDSIWALQDISLDVKRGEVIGIIGRNGAGKSTLLKILSRITYPTAGRVEIRGRVSSLLEVGTGFHPELTGRDNIYLNGAILGMRKEEIKDKFDDIVAFSEIGRFLDTPVKRYSSGMYVRLAFAVAAHLEPEILLVDEVLAVGDAGFRKKCLGKMSDVAQHGRTVFFVSHNMAAVESLCPRTVLLDAGRIVAEGETSDVVGRYLSGISTSSGDLDLTEHEGRSPRVREKVFERLRVLDGAGNPVTHVRLGDDVIFELRGKAVNPIAGAVLMVRISKLTGELVATCDTRYQFKEEVTIRDRFCFRCRVKACRFVPGPYSLTLFVKQNRVAVDQIEGIPFEITPRDLYGTGKLPPARAGVIIPDVEWSEMSSGPESQGVEATGR